MSLSLFAPGRGIRQDPNARSLSFSCTGAAVLVDAALLAELRATSEANGRCNVRLCLHTDPEDPFHEMLILQYREAYYRPHLHRTKGESCHVLEGRVAMVGFDEAGGIASRFLLDAVEAPMARMGPGRWHTVVPLSDPVIYHEAKPGPFLGAGDSVFPDWAPAGEDPEAALAYARRLREALVGPGAP